MADFSVKQFSLIFHFWVFPFLKFPKRIHIFFSVFNFHILSRFLNFVHQKVNVNGQGQAILRVYKVRTCTALFFPVLFIPVSKHSGKKTGK